MSRFSNRTIFNLARVWTVIAGLSFCGALIAAIGWLHFAAVLACLAFVVATAFSFAIVLDPPPKDPK